MAVWTFFLSTVKLSPHSLTDLLNVFRIWSLIGVPPCGGSTIQSSTAENQNKSLYLNIFRGEPAISGFDWHFTPIHKSSHSFATLLRAGLPTPVTAGSPCSWIDHPVSGLVTAT